LVMLGSANSAVNIRTLIVCQTAGVIIPACSRASAT
jgi:hypothetical protein